MSTVGPFPYRLRSAAISRQDYPTHAVAYEESFVKKMARSVGLQFVGPTRYGLQDVLLLEKIDSIDCAARDKDK